MLYLDLLCAFLARCVLRSQKSLRKVFFFGSGNTQNFSIQINGNCIFALRHYGLQKSLKGMLYYQRVGENLQLTEVSRVHNLNTALLVLCDLYYLNMNLTHM